ncbi:hypothetical protein HanRHA438_Chr17g0815211 [Helianthus annuus]|nr:hypothetical protein HanIR_Chr17g0873541 [Helianthus annuus]KAJ0813370.1 hypothetical protein HanPSC8_Chr17g0772641 [Helianthus annuus]KAJ0826517.1 hypothetical protein HanRHA438_Chr17g0815211 [Helianthus annuus]
MLLYMKIQTIAIHKVQTVSLVIAPIYRSFDAASSLFPSLFSLFFPVLFMLEQHVVHVISETISNY